MAFEGLADRLQQTISKIRGKGKVSEQDVKDMMREVRLALLEADVNFKVVKDFVKKVSERAVGQDVMKSLTPGQQVIKVVKEELTELMGGEESKIAVAKRPPTVIMMVGLHKPVKRQQAVSLRICCAKSIIANRCWLLPIFTAQPQLSSWKHSANSLICLFSLLAIRSVL